MADLKDHRQIGKELDLFSFNEYAPGAVFWHPKGWFLYQEIMKLIRSILAPLGYQEIKTPVMVKSDLFKKSGHWQHFGDTNMFNLQIKEAGDEQSEAASLYSLKPMNCPESTLVYNSDARSYRDLPLKYSDFGILHRNELSGVLGGLFRVREFTIDDAHIYARHDQIGAIVMEMLEMIRNFYKLFGFELRFFLSTKPDKALAIEGQPKLWDEAESSLKEALTKAGIKFDIKDKDGAFYGPKIDFHMTDSQDRDWQLATIQLDFQMPRSLDVQYTNETGEKEYAVMMHRAMTGSIERFIGILIEQLQGNFPLWLAPTQVAILPISDKINAPAQRIQKILVDAGFRSVLDGDNKTLPAKIRQWTLQKVPYLCIIGEKEAQKGDFVSVRTREGIDLGMQDINEFMQKLTQDIEKKI
ncbi:threonine--tRNA ligase [Candidatus Roizmanbacteria bacterium RIFCSPHIGHO2_12_FULL_44_10]|uniref:Threonine--tRNA ligase n=1 Tax=Candidatus Roizmanbacteria bacterium RIFCSPHIGHO2_12_FULL_44_10 TaxID=1802054 RepID=A0A1F7I6E0_9BACT|nr:MAG: threonine--tRNA ligase [Candidatus Roizmanbacteria bacterium RIFCSPHIGHO2_12_FULL_44_10]